MAVVVDAGVAIKWFIDEPGSDVARALWRDEPDLLAPDLLVPEVCNAAWRKVRLGESNPAQAQQIAQQAAFLSMMPGFGFSMAATALVGQSLGARNPARADRVSWFSTRACLAWMGTMGIVFFFGGPWIMRAFTDDVEIIEHGVAALRVVALAQPGQAIGIVLAGSLRGAGDTRFPMFTTALAMWAVRLPVAWIFGITLGFGLAGLGTTFRKRLFKG